MNNTHSSRARSTVLPLVLTALFAALTAIGAFLRIPAGEISFTLQVFFTSMAGILLGPWWGAASQVVYVLLGLIGLPIFTEGGGLMYLAKPSCGFLLGLPLMAMVIGLLTRDLEGLDTPRPRCSRYAPHRAGLCGGPRRAVPDRPSLYVLRAGRQVEHSEDYRVRLPDLPAV